MHEGSNRSQNIRGSLYHIHHFIYYTVVKHIHFVPLLDIGLLVGYEGFGLIFPDDKPLQGDGYASIFFLVSMVLKKKGQFPFLIKKACLIYEKNTKIQNGLTVTPVTHFD